MAHFCALLTDIHAAVCLQGARLRAACDADRRYVWFIVCVWCVCASVHAVASACLLADASIGAGRDPVRVQLHRSATTGWGVRAMQPITEGQFVAEYVGEVINEKVAERRGEDHDGKLCV